MNLEALEIIENMISMKEVAMKQYEILSSEQSELDLKIVDLNHVVEFYDFNASQNNRILGMLKEALRRRREVKDQLDILYPFCCNKMDLKRGSGAHKHVKTVMRKIENENNSRHYKVRILNELLGDTLTKETKPNL